MSEIALYAIRNDGETKLLLPSGSEILCVHGKYLLFIDIIESESQTTEERVFIAHTVGDEIWNYSERKYIGYSGRFHVFEILNPGCERLKR